MRKFASTAPEKERLRKSRKSMKASGLPDSTRKKTISAATATAASVRMIGWAQPREDPWVATT